MASCRAQQQPKHGQVTPQMTVTCGACRVLQRRWWRASSGLSLAWSTATSRETESLANPRCCSAIASCDMLPSECLICSKQSLQHCSVSAWTLVFGGTRFLLEPTQIPKIVHSYLVLEIAVLSHWNLCGLMQEACATKHKRPQSSGDRMQAGSLFGCKGHGMNAMEVCVCVCRASAMYIMPVLMPQLLLWTT